MGQICGNTSIPRHPAHSHHSSHCHHRIRLFQVNTFKFLLAFKRLFLKWFCPDAMALSLGCYVLLHRQQNSKPPAWNRLQSAGACRGFFVGKPWALIFPFLAPQVNSLGPPPSFLPFTFGAEKIFCKGRCNTWGALRIDAIAPPKTTPVHAPVSQIENIGYPRLPPISEEDALMRLEKL